MKTTKYFVVYNNTDSVLAFPNEFKTRAAAEKAIVGFRNRFKTQGYYLTSSGTRISSSLIDLSIEEFHDREKAWL